MKESSVHGLPQIVNKRHHWCERLTWMCTFVLAMITSVFLVIELYHKLGINSVTMVLSDDVQSVTTLPFPAVTIFGTYEDRKGFPDHWVSSTSKTFEALTKLTC